MSAFGMKPMFKDKAGYLQWRNEWAVVFRDLARDIRRSKLRLKKLQRAGEPGAAKVQKELGHKRVMAWKLMTLLGEARLRRDRILKMRADMQEHLAQYPLAVEDCRSIDFHFNKGHLEFDFIPMWTIKTKGKTFYCHHVEASVPWTTRERPEDATTKGAIRLRHCNLRIEADGTAFIQ